MRRRMTGVLIVAGIFSALVNALMLTGPLYMLQVYDRVLGSRSEATLIALSILVVFLYTMMGFLDHARNRALGRVAGCFRTSMTASVPKSRLSVLHKSFRHCSD